MLHTKPKISAEGLKPPVPQAYMVVEHDPAADTYSKIAVQFNFATGLGLFTPTQGGGVFAPIKVDGVTKTLFISSEKDISVETFTVVRDATVLVSFPTAKKLYVKYGPMPAEGFGGGKLASQIVANFAVPPVGGFERMSLDGTLNDLVLVFHDINAAQYPALQMNGDGTLNVQNGIRCVVSTDAGRAIPIGDDPSAGSDMYIDLSPTVLYYESPSGADIQVSTLDLFQGGSVYGGPTFDYFLDEETGLIYHNTSFVSVLELIVQYPSYNVLLQVTYTADITGLKSVYTKGESGMGQDDQLVAIFSDEENHQINFSQTLRPLEETQPE